MTETSSAPDAGTRPGTLLHNRLDRRLARAVRDTAIGLGREGREARAFDKGHESRPDPGVDRVLEAGVDWLLAAQRGSASADGGMARNYAIGRGWSKSYPETTGYIVQTLLEPEVLELRPHAREAAGRALDWLLTIQAPAGGWPGSVAGASTEPVTFNTGQILLGFADGVRKLGRDDRQAVLRGGDWLVEMLDPDGGWRRGHSRYAMPGPSVYELHTAWGLAEAADALSHPPFLEAAVRNADWSLTMQQPNGWFDRCDLTDESRPLTHTLAYAVRGLIEVWRHAGTERHLEAALLAAGARARGAQPNGYLPGRRTSWWEAAVNWSCLTGTSQMAICWAILYKETGDEDLLAAMRRGNAFVRKTVRLDADDTIRGGVPGAYPVTGDYGRLELLNWAVKFTVDAQLAERRIMGAA